MPTRAEHLADIRTRLDGKIAEVGDHVYCSRVVTLAPNLLPAICLYAPEEDSGAAEVPGAQPQYQPTHTLAIEIRVPEDDGFDVTAGAITEAIKVLLFTDQGWLNRFKRYPRWRVKQFLERRGDDSFCGEVLTLTVTDRRPTEFRPVAPLLAGITTAVEIGGGAITVTTNVPPVPEE